MTATYSFKCPTCGAALQSASCRAINTHERGQRHRRAVEAQGYPTPLGAYDAADREAWGALMTTPDADEVA